MSIARGLCIVISLGCLTSQVSLTPLSTSYTARFLTSVEWIPYDSSVGDNSSPLPPSLYTSFQLIHSSAASEVYKAIKATTGETVAVKAIVKKYTVPKKVQSKISLILSISHAHIVELRDIYETPNQILIEMEYFVGGSLFQYMKAHPGMSEYAANRIMRQLVSAVQYLHTQGIVHRDIKLDNIFVDGNGNVKLGDFGSAIFTSAESGVSGCDYLHTTCGTPLYAAPEIVNGGRYSYNVDVYSLGVVLYALLQDRLPFENLNEVLHGVVVFRRRISRSARELIEKMLQKERWMRCSIAEIPNYDWWHEAAVERVPVCQRLRAACSAVVQGLRKLRCCASVHPYDYVDEGETLTIDPRSPKSID